MFAHLENGRDIIQLICKGGSNYISPQYRYRDIILLPVNNHDIICIKGVWTKPT
jgi:hypothetical protein